jgi:hypothetical protein
MRGSVGGILSLCLSKWINGSASAYQTKNTQLSKRLTKSPLLTPNPTGEVILDLGWFLRVSRCWWIFKDPCDCTKHQQNKVYFHPNSFVTPCSCLCRYAMEYQEILKQKSICHLWATDQTLPRTGFGRHSMKTTCCLPPKVAVCSLWGRKGDPSFQEKLGFYSLIVANFFLSVIF